MNNDEQIISNLTRRCHPVNAIVAVRNTTSLPTGLKELKRLVAANVIKQINTKHGSLYRYNRSRSL